MIDVTGINLTEAVKIAYDLSKPQGLGFLHAKDGGLTDEEAEARVREGSWLPVNLDYMHGRACKFTVHAVDGGLWIDDKWYDHSDAQLAELLQRLGVPPGGFGREFPT